LLIISGEMRSLFTVVLSTFLLSLAWGLYQGRFESDFWAFSNDVSDRSASLKFVVALNLRNTDQMHNHFLEVSNPSSKSYGKFLTAKELDALYGPTIEAKRQVKAYFQAIPGTTVRMADYADLMEVTAPISEIEKHFSTTLGYVSHIYGLIPQKSLRAMNEISVPEDIANHISFISLNAPVNHVKARGAKAVERLQEAQKSSEESANSVYITAGNNEALVRFQAYCYDALTLGQPLVVNNQNPPCSTSGLVNVPLFQFAVSSYTNVKSNAWVLDTDPTVYPVTANKVYCYNNVTKVSCDGTGDAMHCYCVAKVRKAVSIVFFSIDFLCYFPLLVDFSP
jgi:subtilase family serine protease